MAIKEKMDKLEEYLTMEFHPQLIVVVNQSIIELQKVSDFLGSQYHYPCVYVNKELSKILVSKPNVNFLGDIVSWFYSIIDKHKISPIIIRDIDFLFEPSFKLDPLVIFRQASRNRKLLVFWPGEYINNKLSYATPEHAHYRTWGNPGIEILNV